MPPPPPAAKVCSCNNVWTTCQISYIFDRIDGHDLEIIWLNFGPFSLWPCPWIFKVKYGISYISAGQKWTNCRETKGKQIWNLPNLSQRRFDCHKMKIMHIEWTEGLNDHQIWPWPWPWKVRCKDLSDSDRVTSDVGVLSTCRVDVKQATWLASRDSYATNKT